MMKTEDADRSINQLANRRRRNFENSKNQCLGKRDKSFSGRIDPKAVNICSVINEREEYYTTSSCAGRCFLYQGPGRKSTTEFQRWRISHDKITDSQRYFDLSTLDSDPSGGADPIRSIGQFEHAEKVRQSQQGEGIESEESILMEHSSLQQSPLESDQKQSILWLRFEPFILHVACRSLSATSALMTAARPAFKNVGLTTWKDGDSSDSNFSKYLVAVWGDEGLDMPLSTPDGSNSFADHHEWLAELVNERHQRNWDKIDRFVQSVRDMPLSVEEDDDEGDAGDSGDKATGLKVPKHFDVIGDIAVLNAVPPGDQENQKRIGEAILNKNKAIKLVVARQSNLEGTERAPGTSGFLPLAGTVTRSPLMTSHMEYGIKCIVDLNHTFFSARMGPERLRLCQQVARGEHVLVLFAGVGMEALQIAGRTEARSVVAVEMNYVAVQCMRRAHRMLERNKGVKCIGAAERLEIIEGDVLDVIPQLQVRKKTANNAVNDNNEDFGLQFDRILAPRPKEGSMDGDLGKGDGGIQFLQALLPILNPNGGECHWYDFVADHEFPDCQRTRTLLEGACQQQGLDMEVLHIANAGSVAMRQFRVCVDFRVSPRK